MSSTFSNTTGQAVLPSSMRAMVLEGPRRALVAVSLPIPRPSAQQVLVKILACGICRTDLHVVDGELPYPKLPLIPGHEIIGHVVRTGNDVRELQPGDLVGIPWLGYTCGSCRYCISSRENLCEKALFTGYTLDGGYAEYIAAFAHYCFPLALQYGSPSGAPLLCAGLIGYRSYTMTEPNTRMDPNVRIESNIRRLGIYGFGAAAHILIQVALHEGKEVYAFTRDGDGEGQEFARHLGAIWAGDSSSPSPAPLDAAIIFAPVGALVPLALRSLDKGGTVVCGGIHMSDVPSFPYDLLWEERVLRSVANLTRRDGARFLDLAPRIPIHTTVQTFPLSQANEALDALRGGHIHGAAVLVP